MTASIRPRAVLVLATIVGACGGGGGGGGGAVAGGPVPSDVASFDGFAFRTVGEEEVDAPPKEDPGAQPPTVGAALNTTIIFRFEGVPHGPFDQGSLPIFTTPQDATPEAGLPGTVAVVPAKGTYVLVVAADGATSSVEFRPFVPAGVFSVKASSPPETVPGLLPASTYTVRVSSTAGQAIGNLKGPGGKVQFGTTSNPAAFFPKDPADVLPPALVHGDGSAGPVTTPADGTGNLSPGPFSQRGLAATTDTFPDGPSDILLVYDRPVLPFSANIEGSDLDDDGVVDPTFALRARATPYLVGSRVAAGAVAGAGPHDAFDAVSAFEPGEQGDAFGTPVVLHSSLDGALPGPSPGLIRSIKSMASGPDAGLLYVVLDEPGGHDLLTVADQLLGDATYASLGVAGVGGPEITLDTGLDDLVGLTFLADGRLVGFERSSRRVVEVDVDLVRQRPTPGTPAASGPILQGLESAATPGVGLFLSAPWPGGLEVLDLATAPSGRLFALGVLDGALSPSLVALESVDPDLDGQFEADEGSWNGLASSVVFEFDGPVSAVEFEREERLIALDRAADAVIAIDMADGSVTTLASQVAGFGLSLPAGLSPATTLALGTMDLDVSVVLESNHEQGAQVRLQPRGLLPIGADVQLLERNTFTSLAGVSALHADPGGQLSALGWRSILSLSTSEPTAGPAGPIDDVFLETFDDQQFEDAEGHFVLPRAEWAETVGGIAVSGGLRASVGVSGGADLGDFRPLADAGFNPGLAFGRTSAGLGEPSLDMGKAGFRVVLLDTDSQNFPLADGSTPGVIAEQQVFGGHFAFRDVIIPAGVHVVARGSNPLRITATGSVRIDGVLDVRGTNGLSDDTFDSGFIPVPGGPGGPGAGRGGDGHPTRFDPAGSGAIDQYVTPETGERGWGPVVVPSGSVAQLQVGGFGGLCTLGYDPSPTGFPKLDQYDNREEHRPPGGGGGSHFSRGDMSHEGSGSYLVQSESTWFPFTKCPGEQDHITIATYGNDERRVCCQPSLPPLQCVYMVGPRSNPERLQPGALPGDLVFKDGDDTNDFIGPEGELSQVLGGQGGGGGGSRIDSMRKRNWAADALGNPDSPPPAAQPHYPKLFFGLFFSPTLYDAKGGAGGGGGGAVQIRAYGDIVLGRTGHIDARGGHGGGGEVVQNANFAAGGGGGSGGTVLLSAAGEIRLEADVGHRAASYVDGDGDLGASIEVSGGFGRDARSDPTNKIDFLAHTYDSTRSDGGQGGMGLVQLQAGAGTPTISEGAHVFAKKRAVLKLGPWTGHPTLQKEHPSWPAAANSFPDELRYVDMLHYRSFKHDGANEDRYVILNGTWPPIIPSTTGQNGHDLIHEDPPGSGQFWFDSPMIVSDLAGGRRVVREPQPGRVLQTYLGFDPVTFLEPFMGQGPPPGTLFPAVASIPLSIHLNEPDGTPILIDQDGQDVIDPHQLVDRLPLVHPEVTGAEFSSVSQGTSAWLDFHGATLRPRDLLGRTAPFFAGALGTFNPSAGVSVPAGAAGLVRVGAKVPEPQVPARFVLDAGLADPGLFPGNEKGEGDPPNPPHNDIKVDAPDPGIGREDVITDNATVRLLFQGAYAVRAGSHVPDASTLTDWVADPTLLDGHPLVRFRVEFDLGVDLAGFPFSPESLRPQVDYVRLRASY